MTAPCPAANLLAQKAWNAGFDLLVMRAARGPVQFSGYGEPRGDGTRPIVGRLVYCDSISLTARHPDGRRFYAWWISTGTSAKTGKPSWQLDDAFTDGRWTARRLTAKELTAYVVGQVETEEAA
jgi:hypothetical protein